MTAAVNEPKISEIELDADLGYGKLFEILLRRRKWFLGVFCSVVSISAITAIFQEPVYESSFQLLIESVYRNRESDIAENNVEVENYATQLEIMRSSQLLKKAKNSLKSEYPKLKLKTLEENFEIEQVQGDDYENDLVKTTVLEAVYTDNDPRKTKRVLEAIMQVYQDYTLEQQQERLAQGLAFINTQLPTARQRVTQAENALENFRKNNNLVNPEQRAESVAADLKDTQAQKRQVKVDYQNTLARYNSLQSQLERTPQEVSIAARLSESSRYQTLLAEIQKTELALKDRQVLFKPTDPVIQKLTKQLEDKRSLLRQEAQNLVGEIPSNFDLTANNLLKQGQFGTNDLKSADELVNLQATLNSLKAKENSLTEAEQQLQAELDLFPNLIAEYNRLRPEIDVQRTTVEQLLAARQKLSIEIDRGGFKWQVVEPPVWGEDESPSKLKMLLAGAVIGSFLGVAAAFGKDFLDDTVHSPRQLEEEIGKPLLGVIPELPAENINQQNLDLLLSRPTDSERSIEQAIYLKPLRESLDLIYQNIKLSNPTGNNQSLLVTSIEAGVDNLTLMLGLAFSAVRSNQQVLLLDTNFRSPSLHEKLGISNERGLSNLLMGEVTNANIQTISLLGEEFDVLTAGSAVSDPIKLLNSSQLKELMFAFERNYNLVLLSSPPVLGYVDMLQTAQYCQGIVLIEKIDQITKSKLSEANALLTQLKVLGIVADGGEASEAKLRQIYEPQWQSMLKELPPVDAHRH
jgi:polysaccharide biosynthesis transport protein